MVTRVLGLACVPLSYLFSGGFRLRVWAFGLGFTV